MLSLNVSFALAVEDLREKTGVKDLNPDGLTEMTVSEGETSVSGAFCYHEKGRGVLELSGGIGKLVAILDALFPEVVLLAQVGIDSKGAPRKWEALPDSYHWLVTPTSEVPNFSTDEHTHSANGITVSTLKERIGF